LALVLQIVVVLIVLVGLITTIMSIKNWHWAQMLLLLSIFFASLGVLFLGMEVFRIHRNLRAGMPAKIAKIEALEAVNEAYVHGTRDAAVISRAFATDPFTGEVPYNEEAEGRMPGMGVWRSRIQDLARDRGRVWRDVKAAGPVDAATGRIPVTLPAPRPHGLEKDAIVFAFEQGPPNPATPDQGRQFLGEFRVVEVREDGATLESVQRLDERTGGRLVRSATNPQIAWRLYETMPSDRHDMFAGLSEEDLKKLLPAATINEYLRHGKEATPDDDEYHRAAFNDEGQRVALDDAAKVKELYDRTLRDYAYTFSELLRQKTLLLAEGAGLTEDINRLKAAEENAKKLTAHRQQELAALGKDAKFMERDRQVIEKLLATVQAQLAKARELVATRIPENAKKAQRYIDSQIAELESGPVAAPAGGPLTGVAP
jgi:hypothetical protein